MLGVDIIKIERIEKAVKSAHFVERVFTPYEIAYAQKKANVNQTLAGIYAAKEAVAKALKNGLNGINLKDIPITHDENGCPFSVVFNQKMAVSISHDGEYAIAIAAVEKIGI